MRVILVLWAFPLVVFWTWYALSANDISFGTIFLSRQLHDIVFEVYGRTLGVPASSVPSMMASACAVDSALILSLAAYRWRKSWLPHARHMLAALRGRAAGQAPADTVTVAPSGAALPAE